MKVNVYYTIPQKMSLEVDDKFEKIANDDWYFKNHKKKYQLMEELNSFIESQLRDDADIVAVWSKNDEYLFYEN